MSREPISQEDPDAIEKITERIATLKAHQARMAELNKAWRKKGPQGGEQGLIAAGVAPEIAARIAAMIAAYAYQDKQPYAKYELTNNGGNIRRLEQRLAELTRKAVTPLRAPIKGNGWSLEEDADINRTCLRFDVARVPDEIYRRLKSHGFRHTHENVWQRHRNDGAWYWAEDIGKAYEALKAAQVAS